MVDRLDFDLRGLVDKHQQALATSRPQYLKLDRYYAGVNRLKQLGLAIPEELEQFVVFINWCRKAVDSVENRLDVLGFRMPMESGLDESLQETWDYNRMQVETTKGFLDALSLSVSYMMVSSNEEDPDQPLITVESPTEMSAFRNPRTKRMESMFRSYNPKDGRDQSATLYLPDDTYWLERDGYGGFYVADQDDHGLGRVPGVAMVNRPRTHTLPNAKIPGVSQMDDVIAIVDAAARALTNAQLAQEVLAAPQRGVIGATRGDFVDEAGDPIPAWEAYFGAVWTLGNKDARTFQFDAANMENFKVLVELYARQASGVTGLPPNYFGLQGDDAASDSAIRSRETQLVKFAERAQTNYGGDIRDLAQIVDRFKTGEWNPDLRKLEVVWQNAGTPTKGQVTDAAVKLKEADVLTREDVWEELGYSPGRIAKLKERFAARDAELQMNGVDSLLQNAGVQDGAPVGGDTDITNPRPVENAA